MKPRKAPRLTAEELLLISTVKTAEDAIAVFDTFLKGLEKKLIQKRQAEARAKNSLR